MDTASSFCDRKIFVLVLFVVQNTFYVVMVRYTRTRPGVMYLSSTAVCCDEGLKLVACLAILTFSYLRRKRHDDGGEYGAVSSDEAGVSNCNLGGAAAGGGGGDDDEVVVINIYKNDDAQRPIDGRNHDSFRSYMSEQLHFDCRMAGLAGLFVVQKNLIYLSMSNLDAAVFQVTYQLKILTTATFHVLLLKRKLNANQVIALILLTVGVALVQLDKADENSGNSFREQNRWVGLLAVLGAACTSGFGGVYFELVLKPLEDGETPRARPSVWAKNVQLSAFGLVIALFAAFGKDGNDILSDGFFQGYTRWVIALVTLQAFGGLTVAAIIQYADNILKSFAAAMAIVSSTALSAWLFGFTVSALFACGCVLQFVSIWLYSRKDHNEEAEGNSQEQQASEMASMHKKDSGLDTSTDNENGAEI